MNNLNLLNDYEQFTAFFQSLDTAEECPQPTDLEDILESLHEEETSYETY